MNKKERDLIKDFDSELKKEIDIEEDHNPDPVTFGSGSKQRHSKP